MKLFYAVYRTSITLAILEMSTASVAQIDGAASVLQRYGNLDIERTGPTIDAELGQKYLRRGNTYSNLERFEEAIDDWLDITELDESKHGPALRNYFQYGRYLQTPA